MGENPVFGLNSKLERWPCATFFVFMATLGGAECGLVVVGCGAVLHSGLMDFGNVQLGGAWWAEAMFAAMVGLALLMSKSRLGWPLKWAETFYHELSHGVVCMLTLGRIARIELKFDGSGCCYTRGGWRIPTLLAGYMGASLWGGALYVGGWMLGQSGATTWIKIELAILAVVFVFWVRDWRTLVIMLCIAATYGLALFKISEVLVPLFLQFAGIYVQLNAVRAPLHLIDGQHVGDGAALADIFKVIPEGVWIVWWLVFALGVLGLCMVETLPMVHRYVAPWLEGWTGWDF